MSEVIDHVGIRAGDMAASRRMYEAALAELGFVVLSEGEFEDDAYALFGRDDNDDFCVHAVGTKPGRDRVTTGAHIAFCARDADSVRRWHDAAVRHGGTDIGPPRRAPRVQRLLLHRVRSRSRRQQRRGGLPRTDGRCRRVAVPRPAQRLYPAHVRPDRYIEASELGLDLYRSVAELPIVSPHGHIDVRLFADPAARLDPPGRLFVTTDHYVVRMLYSQGVPLERAGLRATAARPRSTTAPSGSCSPTTSTCSR